MVTTKSSAKMGTYLKVDSTNTGKTSDMQCTVFINNTNNNKKYNKEKQSLRVDIIHNGYVPSIIYIM